jgi:hypothetical protein
MRVGFSQHRLKQNRTLTLLYPITPTRISRRASSACLNTDAWTDYHPFFAEILDHNEYMDMYLQINTLGHTQLLKLVHAYTRTSATNRQDA